MRRGQRASGVIRNVWSSVVRIGPVAAAACLVFAVSVSPAQTGSQRLAEKAQAMLHMAEFVQWPGEGSGGGPFQVCVLGDPPLSVEIQSQAAGRLLHKRVVDVRIAKRPEDTRTCQMVILGGASAGRSNALVESLREMDAVTIADWDGFCKVGGMMEIAEVEGGYHFRVNMDAVTASHLTVSSHFLMLATILHPGKRG